MQTPNLPELIGSRICHDLISPISAIGNGVELLQLSGVPLTPEIELIAQSVANANARIRFFRVAFGKRSPGTMMSRTEISETLAALSVGGRIGYDWLGLTDQSRDDTQLVYLAMSCIETALPLGGDIQVRPVGRGFEIHAHGKRINVPSDIWNTLRDRPVPADLAASHVQFALLPQKAADADRQIDVVTDEAAGHIMIRL